MKSLIFNLILEKDNEVLELIDKYCHEQYSGEIWNIVMHEIKNVDIIDGEYISALIFYIVAGNRQITFEHPFSYFETKFKMLIRKKKLDEINQTPS